MTDQTSSRIAIAAAPAAVLAVITDVEAYPQWTGSVKSAEILTEDEDGRPAEVRYVLDAGVLRDEYVLAYDYVGEHEVRWRLVKGGMLTRLDGAYRLTDRGDGSTDVEYELVADVSIPMLGLLKRKAEKVIVDTALEELKKRVEA
jgi:ribosome-associated toxin RatA of RatAB toxin-antitoxin module